jgi:hypothetical protein
MSTTTPAVDAAIAKSPLAVIALITLPEAVIRERIAHIAEFALL